MDGGQQLGFAHVAEAVEKAEGACVVAVPADVGVEYDLGGGHGGSFRECKMEDPEWGMGLIYYSTVFGVFQYKKCFSPPRKATLIIHFSSAKRLHYSFFI
jgi:hypothetical protein